MLRPLLAGILLGIRAPLRSRFVMALIVLLAVAILVLPAQLLSDGTRAGAFQLSLSWTLSASFGILAAAALWAGCASVSLDKEEKRFVLTALSPARRWQILVGRWLGLSALLTVLLLLSLFGIGVSCGLRCAAEKQPEEVKRWIQVTPEVIEAESVRLYKQIFPQGHPNAEEGESVKNAIVRDLSGKAYIAVEPQEMRIWEFSLRNARKADSLRLDFLYMGSYNGGYNVKGCLELYDARGALLRTLSLKPSGSFSEVLSAEEVEKLGGKLKVIFRNLEPVEGGAGILVQYREALRVYVPGGNVYANLFRAGLVVLAELWLLVGVGVAVGALFSFPVAAFVATALCLLVTISGSDIYRDTSSVHSHGVEKTATELFFEETSQRVSSSINVFVAPYHEAHIFERLGENIRVEDSATLKVLLFNGLLLPLLLLLFASIPMRNS